MVLLEGAIYFQKTYHARKKEEAALSAPVAAAAAAYRGRTVFMGTAIRVCLLASLDAFLWERTTRKRPAAPNCQARRNQNKLRALLHFVALRARAQRYVGSTGGRTDAISGKTVHFDWVCAAHVWLTFKSPHRLCLSAKQSRILIFRRRLIPLSVCPAVGPTSRTSVRRRNY